MTSAPKKMVMGFYFLRLNCFLICLFVLVNTPGDRRGAEVKLFVCELCGSFLEDWGDLNQKQHLDHFEGKIHSGFKDLREHLAKLKVSFHFFKLPRLSFLFIFPCRNLSKSCGDQRAAMTIVVARNRGRVAMVIAIGTHLSCSLRFIGLVSHCLFLAATVNATATVTAIEIATIVIGTATGTPCFVFAVVVVVWLFSM